MAYLLFVVVVPVLGTAGATAFLTGAFGRQGQPRRLRIVGAAVLLVATGLWIFVTAAGGGYAALGAVHELIIASAVALVGAAILILKPPAARRVAAVLLVTAYPMLLVGFALAGSALAGR